MPQIETKKSVLCLPLTIGIGCRYVVKKNPDMNAVYVSRDYFSKDKRRNSFICDSFNWINDRPAAFSLAEGQSGLVHDEHKLYVKVRHGAMMYACQEFSYLDGGERAYVTLPESDQGLAAGQYAVFYQGGVCLGSAVMSLTGDQLQRAS